MKNVTGKKVLRQLGTASEVQKRGEKSRLQDTLVTIPELVNLFF